MVSATSSGICVGPPISFGDGTSHGRLPAPPRALPRSLSHPTGSACRRAREPKARGCVIGAISRWPISRRKSSTETIMASGPAVCRSAATSPTAISPASPPGARRGHRSTRSSIARRRRRQQRNRRLPRRPPCAPAAFPGFAFHPHTAAFPEALSAPRGQPPPADSSTTVAEVKPRQLYYYNVIIRTEIGLPPLTACARSVMRCMSLSALRRLTIFVGSRISNVRYAPPLTVRRP